MGWALLLVLFSPALAADEIGWNADWINNRAAEIKRADSRSRRQNDPPLSEVKIAVAVVVNAAVDEDRLAWELSMANDIYNGLDPLEDKKPKKGSAACGIVFDYVGGKRLNGGDMPQVLYQYRDGMQDNYYVSRHRLSEAAMRLLRAAGPAPAGGILVIYIPSLGEGYGHAYNDQTLSAALAGMERDGLLPAGKTRADLQKEFHNIVLIADKGTDHTLAHEIGHILSNWGHKEEKDNLMQGGATDAGQTILLKEQCSSLRNGAKRL